MSRRMKLHNILCAILSCPDKGLECRAYFQPPSSVKMNDSDPDSSLVGKVASMPTSRFNRHYTKDNLNHDVFEIFF